MQDPNLRHTLQFGIGMHHAGLTDGDRTTCERLFVAGKIQILVATSTLAWGVNTPAHLVVIKGTEYFDAPSRSALSCSCLALPYSVFCLLVTDASSASCKACVLADTLCININCHKSICGTSQSEMWTRNEDQQTQRSMTSARSSSICNVPFKTSWSLVSAACLIGVVLVSMVSESDSLPSKLQRS